MIAVVAAMGREIERDREAFLPGREVAAIEGVAVLRGREARILPHGPRLRDVHGRVGAAQIRRDARIGVEEVEALHVVRPVGRLHRNAFGGEPGRRAGCGIVPAVAVAKSTDAKFGIWVIAALPRRRNLFVRTIISRSAAKVEAPTAAGQHVICGRPPPHDQPERRAADRAGECAVGRDAADDRNPGPQVASCPDPRSRVTSHPK